MSSMRSFLVKMLATIFTFVVAISAFALSAEKQNGAQVSAIWEFDTGVWAENLAVRPNGHIVTTILTSPYLYLVDPTGAQAAALIYSFPNATALTGIVESPPGSDIFYLAAANRTATGTAAVWRVDMNGYKYGGSAATVTKLADVPQAGLLNGGTTLGKKYILFADSHGAIYRLTTKTAEVVKISTDPLLAPVAGVTPAIGGNGLKVRNHMLYWTNTAQALIASAPIRPDGTITAAAKVVVSNLTRPDDFCLYRNGFLVAGFNEVRKAGKLGKVTVVSNSTLLMGSTAIVPAGACEPGKNVFYVSTGVGRIVRVQLGHQDHRW